MSPRSIPELRINVAVSAGTLHVIDELCLGRIGLDEATQSLEGLERLAPRHNRWVVAVLFGLAASAIAWLLRADWGAIVVSGLSSAVGLIARQELGRRSVILFAHPFAAGLIGAALGGLTILLGWTTTPGFCLIVPALMLVPGPHLINGVRDMLENHIQPGLCRLGLAAAILIATALGVVLGAWLTLGPTTVSTLPSQAMRLTLPLDMALAGVAACGFGAFYNVPWRVLWVSILCGVVGHGIRYLCLEHLTVAISTLFACVAIGVIANAAADRLRLPFSAVAFAAAVPMMPGVFIYQSIAGAMRLSAAGAAAIHRWPPRPWRCPFSRYLWSAPSRSGSWSAPGFRRNGYPRPDRSTVLSRTVAQPTRVASSMRPEDLRTDRGPSTPCRPIGWTSSRVSAKNLLSSLRYLPCDLRDDRNGGPDE